MTFSFGISSGWANINLLELQNENTFSTGPLNQQETSIVMSIMCVGALTGNIIILPIGQVIGIKKTIHLFSIPIIVRKRKIRHLNFIQLIFSFRSYSFNFLHLFVARFNTHRCGEERLLFIRVEIFNWFGWR